MLITGSNLKVIATMSVGTDHIDVRKCEDRNIFVARTPDVASDSAAELTVALILITIRRLGEGNMLICLASLLNNSLSWADPESFVRGGRTLRTFFYS